MFAWPSHFLNLCYVGVVIEGVGGGGGTQGGGTGLEAQSQCISTNEPVDAIGGNSAVEIACSVVPDGPKKVSPPCPLRVSRCPDNYSAVPGYPRAAGCIGSYCPSRAPAGGTSP
jgi:hypothetical protein